MESSSSKPRLQDGGNVATQRAPTSSSAKALLYELCAAYKWKPPLFDCHREEGPGHLKQFVFKVIVEIRGNPAIVLEALSEPRSSKKSAADHAAEGALWYLEHLSYFPKRK